MPLIPQSETSCPEIPAVLTCSEYSESVDWPLMLVALNLNLVNINSMLVLLLNRKQDVWGVASAVHSHIDGAGLQRPVTEAIGVVLHRAVVSLSDNVRSWRRGCAASVPRGAGRVWEAVVGQVRSRMVLERYLPVGQVLDVLHCDRKEVR